MKINKNIAISDTGFIFNPASGDSFSTNPVGLEIIRQLKDDKPKEEIIASIGEKFSVDPSTFEKDLADFLSVLRSYQLLNDNG